MISKKTCILVLCAAIAIGSYVFFGMRSGTEYVYKQDAVEATRNVMSIYLEDGMLGLIGNSKECYESIDITANICFINDVASKVLDRAITTAMKIPTEDYFNDDNIVDRLLKRDNEHQFSRENVIEYIDRISEVVEGRLDAEWDLQKYKLN
jgi:hypothetical protein